MLSDPALISNVLGIQLTLDHAFGGREGRKESRREGGEATISSLRLLEVAE